MRGVPDEEMIGNLEARRRNVAGGILFAGLAAAVIIYLSTAPTANRREERLEDSKQYVRQLEFYGGTANVLANEARLWIASLWHGRRLAVTIGCLSILMAGAAFVALTPLPSEVRGGGGPARDRQT